MLEMPILRPILIRTREVGYLKALWNWITKIRKWELIEQWQFELPDKTSVVIPAGFKFDGASIPRPFWFILSPTGLLLIPGLIHDFGYDYDFLLKPKTEGTFPRYQQGAGQHYWDRLFREVAIAVNGFKIINWIAWVALWAFGWFAWRSRRNIPSPLYWLTPAGNASDTAAGAA